MSIKESFRKPFVDPIVSEPIDALEATRVFGGQLGQVVLGGGTAGQGIDTGDSDFYYSGSGSYYGDASYQDGVDSLT